MGRWPILHCTIPTEGTPSLRFLQWWAAMLPAQLSSVLHYRSCMPSSYPPNGMRYLLAELGSVPSVPDFSNSIGKIL